MGTATVKIFTIDFWYPLNKSGLTTSSGTSLRHFNLVTERFTPDY